MSSAFLWLASLKAAFQLGAALMVSAPANIPGRARSGL